MSSLSFQRQWEMRFGRPEPKVICVGRNYRAHAEEGGNEVPQAPLLFAKLPNTLIWDGEEIRLPPGIGHVDSEAELGVVIGMLGRDVAPANAYAHIAGYVCANDVSARDAQALDGQWFRAKGYDTFCPVGPTLVSRAELGDASDLRIQQRLNGETLQDARTSSLIVNIPDLVAYASRIATLLLGDLILTGTPQGVGMFRDPKVTMVPGDVVEIEIEGIGVLRNKVRRGHSELNRRDLFC